MGWVSLLKSSEGDDSAPHSGFNTSCLKKPQEDEKTLGVAGIGEGAALA